MTSDDNTPAVKAFVEHCVLLRLARHPNSRVKSFIVTRRALELVAETLPIVATGGNAFTVETAIALIDEQRCALESRFPSLGAEGAW